MARTQVSPALLEKYRTSAPRYTSYPTAVDWDKDSFDPASYLERLAAASKKQDPLSVYVHLPFCAEMCLYCGCNVIITRSDERVEAYLRRLEREFESIAESGVARRPVRQYHWGGGTPTHLNIEQIQRVSGWFNKAFQLAEGAEVAIEVDPRVTTPEQIEVLAGLGFNRVSMGVQDFELDVQTAIKRVQSQEQTQLIFDASRANGIASVNVDLIYGLPLQTREGFARTVETTIDMRPERVALFHYAHVPWLKKHMDALDMDTAPDSATKLEIFVDATERFLEAGYVYLGLDHFALPDDDLALALGEGKLHRNFMGYTTRSGSDMVSLGVSSIGEVDGCFAQNTPVESDYLKLVDERGFATMRGHRLSADDRLRRDVILGLMCNGRLAKAPIEQNHGIEFDVTFAKELQALEPLAQDGLVELLPDRLQLTSLGQMFMRNVALPFDTYFAARAARGKDGKQTFSKTL